MIAKLERTLRTTLVWPSYFGFNCIFTFEHVSLSVLYISHINCVMDWSVICEFGTSSGVPLGLFQFVSFNLSQKR